MEPNRRLRVLEFTKIRDHLATLCVTSMGAELCQQLTPSDFAEIQRCAG